MFKPRAIELKGPKQRAERATAVSLHTQRRAAIRTRRMHVEKGVDLLLEEVLLEGAEELFGLGQGQPEMLDALMALVEGNDIGDPLSSP